MPAAAYPLSRWIAHRGGGALAPENTLAGFYLAARLGYRAVEFDVMLTADGLPVVIHDETLDRTTGQSGRVPDFTAAELSRLDAGTSFHRAFAGEPLPTLEAVIGVCTQLGLAANIEIKPATGQECATAEVVAKVAAALWSPQLPVLLSSFDLEALQVAQALAPGLPRAALFTEIPPDWEAVLRRLDCTALHTHHAQIDTSAGKAVLAAGVPVAVYTVNSAALAEQCWRAGVQAIFTDRLDLFLP